jgi:hypothetical protein
MPESAEDQQPVNITPMPDAQRQTTVSFLPVAFNAQTLWQSPCFWMVIGSALTLAAIYVLSKRRT